MKREVIMCVDDEKQILDSLSLLFEDEYDVLTFTNPELALKEYLINPSIIAVISDHRMPMMKGIQMFQEMKKKMPNRVCFNVLYTGYSEMEAEMGEMIKTKVINEFLTKACPTKLLMNTIESGIQRVKSQAKHVVL